RWTLSINGESVKPQASFGTVMNFETGSGGIAELQYATPFTRYIWVLLQVLLWAFVALGVLQPKWRGRRAGQKFVLPESTPIVVLSVDAKPGEQS
ncbi:MAG: hypothetical protein RIS69_581, partial [Actinomycetota bacterium]